MAKQTIDLKTKTLILGKFRKVVNAGAKLSGVPLQIEHERIRKTKTNPVERNIYRLHAGERVLALVGTDNSGHVAQWSPDSAKLLRGATV